MDSKEIEALVQRLSDPMFGDKKYKADLRLLVNEFVDLWRIRERLDAVIKEAEKVLVADEIKENLISTLQFIKDRKDER